ncbi:MAG: TRAP transporter small permease subunit [Pseudomonadales bacterium]|nr:TRAP transporter small permease subunit [Pseudomonadales bacterium]
MAASNVCQTIIKGIDSLNETLGRGVAWLTLALVLSTFIIVVMRYLFNLGSVALQESLLYLHSLIFLMGAAYTLRHDSHVRVDIFYRPMSAKSKARVDLIGALFLLIPFCLFIFSISWEYVASAWSYHEGSREAGGIEAVFILKTLLLIMPATVLLQGIAQALRSILILTGRNDPDASREAVDS